MRYDTRNVLVNHNDLGRGKPRLYRGLTLGILDDTGGDVAVTTAVNKDLFPIGTLLIGIKHPYKASEFWMPDRYSNIYNALAALRKIEAEVWRKLALKDVPDNEQERLRQRAQRAERSIRILTKHIDQYLRLYDCCANMKLVVNDSAGEQFMEWAVIRPARAWLLVIARTLPSNTPPTCATSPKLAWHVKR